MLSTYSPQPIHTELDERFYRTVKAADFPSHIIRYRNAAAATSVGLNDLDDDQWVAHFGRFQPLPDNFPAPLALCYHGHQFGHYNPDLGDGRGFLFAQMGDDDGRILDLGTKGSGQTPFSRTADGRLTLKGAVREILATEMLYALGVNTSKTLSVIETGEALQRNDEPSPTRSAVLVRLSHSHIRIGSFQRLNYLDDGEGLEMLVRHVARYYYADQLDFAAPIDALAPALLGCVAAAIARTTGQWLAAGFVHGVLNTDNFNVTGESFDYGPWRFLPRFDPNLTAAYFDQTSRYAYGRQADAALWAVCRLADCFIRFGDKEALEARLQDFFDMMETSLARQIIWRLGLVPRADEGDAADKKAEEAALCRSLFTAARTSDFGFDQIFHDLHGGAVRRGDYTAPHWQELLALIGARQQSRTDPFFDRERAVSLTIDEVEAIWDPIARDDDWSLLSAKLDDIQTMGAALRA